MGLLDALQSGAGGAGLLSFLQSLQPQQMNAPGLPSDTAQYGQPMNAMAQAQPQIFAANQPSPLDNASWPAGPNGAPQQNAQPSPLDNARWPAGPIGAPSQANAQIAPAQPPVPQQPPQVIAAQPQSQSTPPTMPQANGPAAFFDRLANGLQSVAQGGTLQGAVTGNYTDPRSVAKAQQDQVQNLTARALLAKGIDPQVVAAAVQPGNTEMLKALVTQNFGPQNVQALGNGYVWDAKQGKAIQAYEPESKKTFTSYKDAMGNEVPGTFDPSTGKFEPVNPQTARAAPSLPSSIEELQKSDPAMASQVQAVLDGRVPYPTGSRLNPKQQQLKEYVTQIDPTFDATTSRTRAKFNMEFGSTSPSTVGGQKILMGTALGHLGEVADSAAALHNSDGGGLAFAGHWANAAKNMTTENAAKANALEDKVAKFSGEVGKLYSGSQGGGVHEREDTRARMGASLTSAELASGLEASRDLILSKQKALEDQAATIFGPEKAAKYDFIGPDGRKALDKIEGAIVKLRGGNGSPSAGSPDATASVKDGDIAHNPQTGETIIRKNGKWIPLA